MASDKYDLWHRVLLCSNLGESLYKIFTEPSSTVKLSTIMAIPVFMVRLSKSQLILTPTTAIRLMRWSRGSDLAMPHQLYNAIAN